MDKRILYSKFLDILKEKISIARRGMEEAQASANNETKSSAGDKYETGRAMSQRERDLHARQLSESINMQKTFANIDPKRTCTIVELGALVETSNSLFFVCSSLGKITIEGKDVMAVSAIAPVAQAMLGKKPGEHFKWMNNEIEILSIS